MPQKEQKMVKITVTDENGEVLLSRDASTMLLVSANTKDKKLGSTFYACAPADEIAVVYEKAISLILDEGKKSEQDKFLVDAVLNQLGITLAN